MPQITTSVILHTQRALEDGRYPIRLRVYVPPKRKYYSLPLNHQEMLYATEEAWQKIHSPKPRGRLKEYKLKIAYYEQRAEEVVEELAKLPQPFSFERFERHFFGGHNSTSVFGLFEDVIAARQQEERIGTALSYGNALSNLKKFLKGKDLSWAEVTEDLLKQWEAQMRAEGRSVNTIGIYMRSLRTIYNEAIKQGIAKSASYPFRYYKIPAAKKAKRALSKADIQRIYAFETVPQSPEGKARDYFLFSYLMQGMNFTDMAYLKNKDVPDERVSYYRRKTARSVNTMTKISVKITGPLQVLLKRLRTDDMHPKEYVFPVLDATMNAEEEKAAIKQWIKTTNHWLKRIGKKLDLPLMLTTYVARHSYATILKRQGAPTALISEALGHQSEKTTQNYLDSFEQDVFDALNQHLL